MPKITTEDPEMKRAVKRLARRGTGTGESMTGPKLRRKGVTVVDHDRTASPAIMNDHDVPGWAPPNIAGADTLRADPDVELRVVHEMRAQDIYTEDRTRGSWFLQDG
ncbi:hypothetical protein C8R46DRAFT_1042356 [Mycena filopes]|nr:hypothetical protein C8R46DRAFT_1042356 [Mycena filopes]